MSRSGEGKVGRELKVLAEACLARGDVSGGKELLNQFEQHPPVTATSIELSIHLIRLCALSGTPEQALTFFQAIAEPPVVAWGAIFTTLSKLGRPHHALHLFFHMPPCIAPNSRLYVTILQACSTSSHVHLLESQIVENALDLQLYVCNALIHMYAHCGCLESARHVFNRLAIRSVVTWCTMISGYAKHGFNAEALQLFRHMHLQNMEANQVTILSVLKACTTLHDGKFLHSLILCRGMESNGFVVNSLLDMYAKCGSFDIASSLLDRSCGTNVVTWTAMIGGCIQYGQITKAFKYFARMLEEGFNPNEVTFVSMLKACSLLLDIDTGKLLYFFIVEMQVCILGPLGNSLIDMYGKHGSLDDALNIFKVLPQRGLITWSAMMGAYSHNGCDEDVLHLFEQMQQAGALPDIVILACTLKACSAIAALEQGKLIHSHILEHDVALDTKHLIELYVKCGCIEDACRVFDMSRVHSLATWNTVISGCCESSKFNLAKRYFSAMEEQGIESDHTTLSCLLFLCSHMGLLSEGFSFFKEISRGYHASPKLEHFVSLVHLLGCTGQVDEAKCLLATMPSGPGPVGWRSLLSQCKAHSQVALGQQCFHHVASGDQREAAGYVLMSNMYVQPGTEGMAESEELRKYVNAWKKPAKACIEVLNKVHSFSVKDEYHPFITDIHAKLRLLRVQMAEAGHLHSW
ncbi:hypothetical protein GOP47_0017066 [Adiantum capillus-veneris]|uniref:Pentatricopeptide repeat-containing protein n=1 Tax=Adiantum capillus-veneris TaxID=13818 RepID=A0A9D4UIW2_ADICA|nr:hypothetical protein GOP47_0017066 [Adiantum capillus-veneris]